MPTIAVAEMAFAIEKLVEGRRRDELLDALRRLVMEFAERLFDFNVNAACAYRRILARARRWRPGAKSSSPGRSRTSNGRTGVRCCVSTSGTSSSGGQRCRLVGI